MSLIHGSLGPNASSLHTCSIYCGKIYFNFFLFKSFIFSLVNRHLTEFVGLDLEMEFEHHYHEVMLLIGEMFNEIFRGLETQLSNDIEIVGKQFPAKPFR